MKQSSLFKAVVTAFFMTLPLAADPLPKGVVAKDVRGGQVVVKANGEVQVFFHYRPETVLNPLRGVPPTVALAMAQEWAAGRAISSITFDVTSDSINPKGKQEHLWEATFKGCADIVVGHK